jgi:hypothetical protein
MKNSGMILLAAIAVLASAVTKTEARVRIEKELGSFASTGVDDNAGGRAKLQVRNGSDGRLEVRVQKLDKRATYDVLVDGVLVGHFTTSRGGSGHISFKSHPRTSKDILLGFDPRGALLIVRDDSGHDVLAVTLADTGSVSGGDVICCVPDDSGPDCEDRTPAECTAQGGTVSSATSCLPNPCVGAPPPSGGDVICCIPDDSGPECEDRTADDCAVQGGVVVQAASCVPNPCASVTPPADGDIQCCLADDSGPACEDRTLSECAVAGGVNVGAGTCAPDSCAALPPQPAGAGTVKVKCEQRSGRSKISVDGSNLAVASYQARATSGVNTVTAPARPTIGDEVEFDFDSAGGDIAAGATPIDAAFIQGTPPQVTGAILTLGGGVVVEATVDCVVK